MSAASDRSTSTLTRPIPPQMRRAALVWISALILLAAATVRISDLSRYPPGPHYDEAANVLIARSIAFGGARPFPMVEAYQGREVLYYYLSAPAFVMIHDSVWSLRIVGVFVNLLTIAAAMTAGRLLVGGRRGWIVGLVVGVVLMLSFHQVWLSRQAYRAVTLPLMQALTLALLWRGWRSRGGGWAWLIAGGICAGLTVYTYNSGRLFPLWVGIVIAALVLIDRRSLRQRIAQGAAIALPMILVAAPMAVYALARPEVFFGRLIEVTSAAASSVSLGESIRLHAEMVFLRGDPYFRYNIPDRPYFSLIEGGLLILGWGVSIGWLLRRGDPIRRAGAVLIALSPLMILPSVISTGGLPPSHMRSLGMIPAIVYAIGIGALLLVEGAARMGGRRAVRALAIAGVVLAVGGWIAVAGAYRQWASRPDLFVETDADLATAAAWAGAHVTPNERIYIAARDKGHPTVEIALDEVIWLGTDTLMVRSALQSALLIFPRSAPPLAQWRSWLASWQITDGLPIAPDGAPAFSAYRVVGPFAVQRSLVAGDLGGANAHVRFVGTPDSANPNNPLLLTPGIESHLMVVWQITSRPTIDDLTPIYELLDARGNLLVRGDLYSARTRGWRASDWLVTALPVTLPNGTPPGAITPRFGWISPSQDRYLTYDNGGIWVVGAPQWAARGGDPDALETPILAPDAPGLVSGGWRLRGWSAPPVSARPGETLAFSLDWERIADQDTAPDFDAVAIAGDGAVIPLWSGAPFDGVLRENVPPFVLGENVVPFETIDALLRVAVGDAFRDRVRWRLPRDLPAGEYRVQIAFDGVPLTIGSVSVSGAARLTEPPAVAVVRQAAFDNGISVYGYTLAEGADSSLTIVWRADAAPDDDYSSFIHLLDATGTIRAQCDAPLIGADLPSSAWLPGDHAVSVCDLPALSSSDSLRVGMYRPSAGGRARLRDEDADALTLSR